MMMALQWFYWGVLATLAQTLFDAAAVGLRLTRMSLPMMLGTMWTPNRSRATVIGFANHIVNGLLFTLVYVAAFHLWGRHGWWLGALVGLAQAAFVLLVGMQILPAIHPRMATEQSGPSAMRQLEPPGFLALNYGPNTPIAIIISHVIFGMVIGAFCP